jgi:hypothetical protein
VKIQKEGPSRYSSSFLRSPLLGFYSIKLRGQDLECLFWREDFHWKRYKVLRWISWWCCPLKSKWYLNICRPVLPVCSYWSLRYELVGSLASTIFLRCKESHHA